MDPVKGAASVWQPPRPLSKSQILMVHKRNRYHINPLI
jgi:hypothetical protein